MADLVVSDLTRLEDWESLDRLIELLQRTGRSVDSCFDRSLRSARAPRNWRYSDCRNSPSSTPPPLGVPTGSLYRQKTLGKKSRSGVIMDAMEPFAVDPRW